MAESLLANADGRFNARGWFPANPAQNTSESRPMTSEP